MKRKKTAPNAESPLTAAAGRQEELPLCPQWFDNPGNFPSIPQPPHSILACQDSDLRSRAIDAWLCACRLRKIIDVWRGWFIELETTGDADPGAAFRLCETASACVQALWDCGAKIPTLQRDNPNRVGYLPPDDSQVVESALPDAPFGAPGEWQKDQQYIDKNRDRLRSLHQFQGELASFMTQLANSPSTGFATPPTSAVKFPPPPPANAIIALGGRRYRIGTHSPFTVEENEDTVLQALLEAPDHTLDKPGLISAAGIENAPTVLSRLRRKYGGILAPAIRCPGHRGGGGYHVAIEAAFSGQA